VAVTADAAYDVVADITQMPRWSPECVDCRWLDGATGPAVGARFRGRNRHGMARWSNRCRVVTCEHGREFSFVAPDPLGRDMTRWTYRFVPDAAGSEVVQSFELLRRLPVYIRVIDRFIMGVKDRRADLEQNMRHTLGRLKEALEAPASLG
jgi:hypothetical protein